MKREIGSREMGGLKKKIVIIIKKNKIKSKI